MKSLFSLLLAVMLIIPFSSCHQQDFPDTSDSEPVTAHSSVQSEIFVSESSVPKTVSDTSQEISYNNAMIKVNISFHFTHMPTIASNQFAVWIEDNSGNHIKTIYATDFTAKRRGYRNRDTSLSYWTASAQPDSLSDNDIDTFSGATPYTEIQNFEWNLTDSLGKRVPDGIYQIKLEGTLFWESNILYTAEIDTQKVTANELPLTYVRSEPDNPQNETMITDVQMKVFL